MATTQIREELHEYIDTEDEKRLEAIYLVLKDNINSEYSYSPDELSEIYSRRNRFIKGDEKVFTTEELIELVHQNKL
jgi:hypothetical protein